VHAAKTSITPMQAAIRDARITPPMNKYDSREVDLVRMNRAVDVPNIEMYRLSIRPKVPAWLGTPKPGVLVALGRRVR
jgi:hypothetical protein